MSAQTLTRCGAQIDLAFEGPAPALPRQAFVDWISAAARADNGSALAGGNAAGRVRCNRELGAG